MANNLKSRLLHAVDTIKTRGRADLVIHHGPTAQNTAAVLMEVKRPGNKGEMISQTELNRKAMHEAVLYYLRERIEGKNTELKHIIITKCGKPGFAKHKDYLL